MQAWLVSTHQSLEQKIAIAIRTLLTLTLLLGWHIRWPSPGWLQLLFPWQANGSLLTNAKQQVVGSALLAQKFERADSLPLPPLRQRFRHHRWRREATWDELAATGRVCRSCGQAQPGSQGPRPADPLRLRPRSPSAPRCSAGPGG